MSNFNEEDIWKVQRKMINFVAHRMLLQVYALIAF